MGSLEAPPEAQPSASILLISPQNTILLLHRVHTSSTFASAHVFPGGVVSGSDGPLPPSTSPFIHTDSNTYRTTALRETFEESGILLARRPDGSGLWDLPTPVLEEGRKAIHGGKVDFQDWVREQGGKPDMDGLVPFTRWITPSSLKRRFSTMMYLYFLPLEQSTRTGGVISSDKPAMIPKPTHDGGLEHKEAQFLSAGEWLRKARGQEIILFEPQFFLLHLLSSFLTVELGAGASGTELEGQRHRLRAFVEEGRWGDRCISPRPVPGQKIDGKDVWSLDWPGWELDGSNRYGETERILLSNLKNGKPSQTEVRWRRDLLVERGKL